MTYPRRILRIGSTGHRLLNSRSGRPARGDSPPTEVSADSFNSSPSSPLSSAVPNETSRTATEESQPTQWQRRRLTYPSLDTSQLIYQVVLWDEIDESYNEKI